MRINLLFHLPMSAAHTRVPHTECNSVSRRGWWGSARSGLAGKPACGDVSDDAAYGPASGVAFIVIRRGIEHRELDESQAAVDTHERIQRLTSLCEEAGGAIHERHVGAAKRLVANERPKDLRAEYVDRNRDRMRSGSPVLDANGRIRESDCEFVVDTVDSGDVGAVNRAVAHLRVAQDLDLQDGARDAVSDLAFVGNRAGLVVQPAARVQVLGHDAGACGAATLDTLSAGRRRAQAEDADCRKRCTDHGGRHDSQRTPARARRDG